MDRLVLPFRLVPFLLGDLGVLLDLVVLDIRLDLFLPLVRKVRVLLVVPLGLCVRIHLLVLEYLGLPLDLLGHMVLLDLGVLLGLDILHLLYLLMVLLVQQFLVLLESLRI